MLAYLSRNEIQYLINLIDYDIRNTEQTQELREQGQEIKGYLEGMLEE